LRLGEQIRPGLRELHIGAALVLPKPATLDREPEAGAIFGRPVAVFVLRLAAAKATCPI
jgi:hypothetical protein